MRSLLPAGAIVLLLSGCTAQHWVQDEKTEAQIIRDQSSCAQSAAPPRRAFSGPAYVLPGGHAETDCMAAKGYHSAAASLR